MRRGRSRRYREANVTTQTFYCGPGRVTSWYHNDYEDYDSSNNVYDEDAASDIEFFIFQNLGDVELGEYFENDAVESVKFTGITSIKGRYYTVWEVTYDTAEVSEDEIIDFLTGQMADGWGEGLEQHPFASDSERETIEFEDEDEDGNYSTQQDEVTTYIEYYFSPWSGKDFEVISD